MKKTAPLRTPTRSRSRPCVVGRDLGAELADARLQRVLVDEDLAHPLLQLGLRHASRIFPCADGCLPSQAPRRCPGTATTSSPGDDERPRRRAAALGTFASTKRSCTFFGAPRAGRPDGACGRRARGVRSRCATARTRHGPRGEPRRTRARRGRRRRDRLASSRRSTTRSSASVRSSARGSRGSLVGEREEVLRRRPDAAAGGAAGSRRG